MINNEKIIKTLELCVTAIKAIHPILDPEEPCIAWEAVQETEKLIKELQDHNVPAALNAKRNGIKRHPQSFKRKLDYHNANPKYKSR